MWQSAICPNSLLQRHLWTPWTCGIFTPEKENFCPAQDNLNRHRKIHFADERDKAMLHPIYPPFAEDQFHLLKNKVGLPVKKENKD
jgi:hypothetical protein